MLITSYQKPPHTFGMGSSLGHPADRHFCPHCKTEVKAKDAVIVNIAEAAQSSSRNLFFCGSHACLLAALPAPGNA